MAGRPKRTAEVTPIFLRISPALLARVDRCQALLQLQTGVRYTRTMAVEVLLGLGCAATEAGYEQHTIPAQQVPVSPISEPSDIAEIEEIAEIAQVPSIAEIPDESIEIEPEPTWETPAPVPAPPPSPGTLPAHVQRIAEVAAQYSRLSLGELAQLLYTRGIYRARDRKTGLDTPVNRGTLTRWLAQAREAGVL